MTEEKFEYQEPEGKGMVGDLSQGEASTGSNSKNWSKKTADLSFASGKTKESIAKELRQEVDEEVLKKVKKEYKRLKKYSKSNLFTIQKLNGQKTIIDELIEEYEQK
ncbi:hypothetical protein KNU05_gp122 [Synechococcus virus S-PRM1]|uniref:Uncharacterized protein n=1 Tax=Synechococcus virus S-PRM1 TaxID=2100130 RepID=A0A346FKC7_9CAUD|nr:hypothetical protein KNU05_gp122 [Synechococcus virus S-PRM1]AXN58432.1 hypothetical protein [Synechococcus virus S-PRM1]